VHGKLRHSVGFDVSQVGAEYRALRASVLRLWMRNVGTVDATVLEEIVRFNEGIDQGLAEAERPATSLGLGLFIAREIVQGHDGKIIVASSADEGTTFTVRMPCTS